LEILANSLEEAEEIKNELNSGDLAISYDSYEAYEYATIDESNNDYSLVQQSILNTPILAHSSTDGWMVINVQERDFTEINTTTSISDIETNYKVYNTLSSEVKNLRESATIEVDSTLFDDIYEVWRKKNDNDSSQ
jgi:hypothetical protein